MLQTLRLGPVVVDRSRYLPPMMLPLVHAALRGEDVMPALDALTRRFGFDTFLYATASYHVRPDNDERMYIFTTAPLAWVMRREAIAEGARLGLYFGDRWESSRVARSSGDAAQDPSIPNPVSETGGRAARARTSSA